MSLTQLLENLQATGIELWVDGDELCYEAPEDVLTPELLAQIKRYKLEIIRNLAQGTDNPSTYPLSHGQQALWFLYQLAPESTAYNTTYAARLVTNLDVPALKQATQALIERHPVLRTTFTSIDGEPVQTVHQNQQVCFSIQEAFNWSQDEVNNWLSEVSDRPFDLEHGPILRFRVLIHDTTDGTLATKEHILLISAHHIVVDFWSLEIIVSELRLLYQAITTGVEPLLRQQNCQYRDYVNWSKQMLSGTFSEGLYNYWSKQLSGELPILNLPTDRPRPAIQTYNGATYFFAIEEQLVEKLKELASQEGVSVYTLFFAALQVLLLRYTNQEDILIGSPMANRNRKEFENIIGYFTNPVVLRADMSGNPTFQELLERSRSSVLNALDHQEYPFPLLVEQLQPIRDPSRSPLYQVAFAWDSSHHGEGKVSIMDSDGLIVESLIPGSQGAPFDLTLTIVDVPGSLKGTWNYNTDLFDASTIERMSGHFRTMLTAIVANPQQGIDQLPILTPSEQQQLLVEWNRTQADYPQDKCIHQLFEEQVQRTPDAVAVVFENEQLTYQQLNCRANQLAHYLQSLGVGADVLVGICVERSLEMVVGLLGILKAGGAYVPLDPEYPTERLSFMLEDAQVRVLLTQQSLLDRLPADTVELICLDTENQVISQWSQDNPITNVQPSDLAYVIYTSGSTGQPKGVQILHDAVSNFLSAMQQRPGITKQDILLGVTTIAFDIAALEIFLPITVGACLVIAPGEATRDGRQLLDLLVLSQATIMQATPATWRLLLEANYQSSNLKILCGGEAFPRDLANELCAVSASVWNLYGPSETTIWSSVYQVESKESLISIGRAIANTLVYILDKNLQPVPIGVPGELHIGGAGVARGYLNRPELTQQKFIPNPFDNSKLYKTGDLARYLPDGNIEYLGRIDHQVKIRGFRIELGEIEAVLSQHDNVQACCVLAREDILGDKRLVAYIIVKRPQIKPTISELRQFLKAKLPEYMIPGAFVVLESLPLTPNGKVDRRALPIPELDSTLLCQYVAPRTPTEEMLALLWAQVLKVELVGIHDNFFTLGGHSLLATQLVSRIRNMFKVELPLRELFAAATVAELAPRTLQLQQQNLEQSIPPILAREENAELPLSFAQQRLWFLDQLEPNSPFYNIPIGLRIVGNLQVAALLQSLQQIIVRHEALRTNFITVEGKPTQIIHTPTNWTFSVVDLLDVPTTEIEIATHKLAKFQAIQPFDLASEPLIRATLVVQSQTEHVLLVCMHHIVSDGWSMGVFVEELTALYNAYSIGQPSGLEPLAIQYADFAIWQRNWLVGDVLQSQLDYWLQQLKASPALLSLPTDRPRPSVQTFSGAHIEFALSMELSAKLTKLSQEQGCTLFMTLLAAFDTLLYRYSGQEDILVGTPIANRDYSEIESLIGFFVNTLVMRTDVSGNPSFMQLLSRVRSMAIDAYAHQNLPFEMLVEALQPQRDLSHTPLFQVMFALQNAPSEQIEFSGLTITEFPIESETAKFDLTIIMQNTAHGLVGVWEYNTDLFDKSTIERMSGHFRTMLTAIVANPQQGIDQLPILTPSEQQQLLVEWNRTQADYPQDKCIHQLFEEQVQRTPDAVAVVFENEQLTYQQLNCRANQLAHYLQSLGVGADVLVGICVERSLEMVVGLLGILKAGGAYVPLDPEYPTERLSFILEDAQVRVLLTQQHLVEQLPKHQATQVFLAQIWSEIVDKNQDNPTSGVTPGHLANVIYTSGSTGLPKGVMVEHRGLCNLAIAQKKAFGLDGDSRVLQFASLSFDASIWEILMAFGSGAKLYLVSKDALMPGIPLIERLRDYGITHITLPPSALFVMPIEELPVLQTIIVAGEACSGELIRQWSAGRNFFNAYGPTEATVCATIVLGTPLDQKISIGRPIANTQIYILDSHEQPVPIGVPGELHIGGVGLARGYLNRTELTLEKFIPNPFDNSKVTSHSSKLYKTGDLARYLPNGNIEYLGRIDHQVKIRGFRIELGEIEAVLSQHDNVQACCVLAREDILGDKRLVAYIIVKRPQIKPTISELRQFLKAKLPEYMIPGAFVVLESLPLTPNGKVDRRALPIPELDSTLLCQYVAPRTPTEEMLALLWAQVLKVELVGIHDNFFTLGGHSLLATQLVSRIRNMFKVELPLRELFAAATVAELAPRTLQLQQQNLEQSIPPILAREENAELPLSFAQQRLWFLDQLEPNSPFYNIPIGLRIVGNLQVAALLQSLQQIIVRHEALRTNFITVEGKPTQIIHTPTNWTFSVVDLLDVPTTEIEIATHKLAKFQAIQPFDLASEPLIRATLVVQSQTEHVLLVCMHHIVSDGWSMGVFVEELTALYNAYSIGQPSGLEPLAIQYADFAIWQRNWLVGDVLQSQLDYWLQQLKASPALLSLPTDRPRPSVQTFSGAHIEFALSMELSAKLTKLSQEQGCTLFMTLLAAFDTLLYRYSGQEDILVGTPIANRDYSEIESLIGFFVNTLVMRTDVSGNPSFMQLLSRVRSMAIDAYAHQNLPFEMLVEALQPQRDLSHTPLFQVMFALQNAPSEQIEFSGLTITEFPIESETAKFDLTIIMQNTAHGLVGVWEYNTDLFDKSTIERMSGHFRTMLTAIVANPQQGIDQLPILTPSEQQQLLVEWNRTQADYPQDKCIHQLFEEQVQRTPDAVAVVFENEQLTYQQLNCRANQLAHYLQSLGVGADVLVGICVERSLEMVVGLLGILKAGGAYVPLDPEYPTERLSFILEDAQVRVLLTQQHLVEKLPSHQAQLVYLDTSWEVISQWQKENPINAVHSSNLAYVIYTSGSTGQPKGALNTHLGICNRLLWMQQAYQLTEIDCILQKTPFSFDVSVWEFFWPLLTGAHLVVAKLSGHKDSSYLVNLILEQQVTTVHFVPSMLQVFLEEQSLKNCRSLKRVICSGEALPKQLQEKFFARMKCELHNLYGPTEAAIDVTAWQCQPDGNLTTVPIGRPIANTQIYILDSHLQPVPIGVPGELHIGGVPLGRGYLNRPQLTQGKFIFNPFSNYPDSRLYKTGDLARYLPDGNIEYLGRIDHQVKIRYFRIELGEIEAVLSQHGNVQACCVVAREDTRGDKRLVAYMVPYPHQTITVSELRQFLKAKLPEYMIPGAFVVLESLPLTPNGKVDRRALPIPELDSTLLCQYVAPRTPTEEMLALLWAQVLKVELVGIHDNFFTLGGHSLLATQLVSRIRNIFKVELPLRELFAAATVAELAPRTLQ
ncbi:amino acid adenylation domain-containing protein, partial [Scytonema sp. UIC 10036]|uniref:non-ribosomal peptide synthetase n=1 Tax=Scytonema sp. UIC 10036 TaxID=2304196 RepID=UPI0012DAA559